MSGIRFFNIHRSWEDMIGMLLGMLIIISPWFVSGHYGEAVMANAVIVGLLVLALAQLEYVSLHRWEEIGSIACGLWLAASPYIFDYAQAGSLRAWHFLLGAAVILLAALELWQDWRLSDREFAQHGL